jgi:hypothetical protein
MEEYSLGLALFDYLPVLVAALGLYWLAQSLGPSSRMPALLGVALVATGGLCKASWKLIWVVSHQDLTWMANMLFILMAPGMILLAAHSFAATRRWNGLDAPAQPNLVALLLIAAVMTAAAVSVIGKPESRAWFFIMLAGASIANITISSLLIRQSWRCGEKITALVFLLSISLILGLSGLSRISAGSAPLQWLAECLNLLAHGSFALGIYRLRPHIPNPTSPV